MSEAEAQQAPLDDVGDDSDRVTMNRRIIACITVYQPDSQECHHRGSAFRCAAVALSLSLND